MDRYKDPFARFEDKEQFLLSAKTGIVFASLLAGILGLLWLRNVTSECNDSAHP